MELLRRNFAALFAAILLSCGPGNYQPQTGDIVLQDLKSPSSEAIKAATGSPYSHCGLVSVENESAFVIEAVGPVRKIPLEKWIENGGGRYSVFRLREGSNTDDVISTAEEYLGLPYDRRYLWGDDEFYCSELVFKAYSRGCGIRLCDPRRMRDYDLESVGGSFIERFGGLPGDWPVVAPGDLARSELLIEVFSNMRD
jgi:hypothetical protein